MIGKTFLQYEILEQLGAGGMGIVYKALDKKLDRLAALKFLPAAVSSDPEQKKRFLQEAQAASSLDHPNICTIYQIGETKEGQLFIAMACYEGETLKKKLDSGILPLPEAMDITAQITAGLKKAHSVNMIHRDIKPANIIITEDGIVKILDFGLAKIAGMSGITDNDTTVGTAAFMSPEQTRGTDVDHRTDIWSTGVLIYQMLTGRLPFRGEYEQAIIYSILNEEPEVPSRWRDDLPGPVESIILKCLAKELSERYQDVDELKEEIEAFTGNSGSRTTAVTGAVSSRTKKSRNHGAKVFLSYSRKNRDGHLADTFFSRLQEAGFDPFLDSKSIRPGDEWFKKIDEALEACDYLLIFLSKGSLNSEMVTEEVRRAKKRRETNSDERPVIIPVRVQLPYGQDTNYELAGYLESFQQILWNSEKDTERILSRIISVISEGTQPEAKTAQRQRIAIADTDRPLPNAPLELDVPTGTVSLQSKYYVVRKGEKAFVKEVLKPGALMRIKAPRQFGKTSLLARIQQFAKSNGHRVIPLTFQKLDERALADLDQLLKNLCAVLSRKLGIPVNIKEFWDDEFLGLKMKCSFYIENYVFEKVRDPIVFAIDEADRLFKYKDVSADFFSMLRAWHEEAKNNELWQQMKIIITHSTEVNLSMEELNQSPFANVGIQKNLLEFSFEEVRDLVNRHELDWKDSQVQQLMALIGGYPYLVRKALYDIAQDNFTFEQFLKEAPTDEGPYGDHLRRHLSLLRRRPKLQAEMKCIIETGQSAELDCFYTLTAGGLIKGEPTDARPGFELYRLYFESRI